jgi:hypothetical protein
MVMKLPSHPMKLFYSLIPTSAILMIFSAMKLSMKPPLRLLLVLHVTKLCFGLCGKVS